MLALARAAAQAAGRGARHPQARGGGRAKVRAVRERRRQRAEPVALGGGGAEQPADVATRGRGGA
eukprot:7004516-Pyramimonas_sp.AAC.2